MLVGTKRIAFRKTKCPTHNLAILCGRLLFRQKFHDLSNILEQHLVHEVDVPLIKLGKFGEVVLDQKLLHVLHGGKISNGHLPGLVDVIENARQTFDEFVLLRFLPEHGGHLCAQVGENECVGLGQSCPLDDVVKLPHGRGAWEGLDVVEEVILLCLKEATVLVKLERPVPERPDVHPAHFGRLHDLAQGPHEGPVDAHQLLRGDGVRLVQDDPHLLLVLLDALDHPPELVRYVQLVSVEQHDDHICPVREPLDDRLEVVPAVEALFLSGQDPGRVDQRDALEDGARDEDALHPAQEGVAELLEGAKLVGRVHGQGVARCGLLVWSVHDGGKLVGRGLRPDTHPREVPFEEVANERRLSGGVLTDKEDHWLRIKVSVVHAGRVELTEFVHLFERQKLGLVHSLQSLHD